MASAAAVPSRASGLFMVKEMPGLMWRRCHRRIIADHLLASGCAVLHNLRPGKIEPASLTPGAHAFPDGIVYPAASE